MTTPDAFAQLGLSSPLLAAVRDVGYETPSPIQAACIPALLEGKDLLGQAQTGTGKTAAFALPLLQRLNPESAATQILVLAPTRELAIQVAEAFQRYAHHLKGVHVMPVYGGQAMGLQLKQLARGAQVVIGTPGRIMDHLERGTLKLDALQAVVLDEADEMLRMGFIDDVETILKTTPKGRQTALFSATMPEPIRRIAHQHLNAPQEVRIKTATSTNAAIEQHYWVVSGANKLDALTRMLEVEDDLDAAIVFVRTKTATVELADRLRARGHAAAELNGDLTQVLRERIIDQLKSGQLDIVIATDVAARGLDVPRISHVINYDIPYDIESYVHRIGRTGRAGRTGKAILFVAPRETRMLRAIEKATRQQIAQMRLPSLSDVSERRVAAFKTDVLEVLANEDLEFFQGVVAQIKQEHNVSPREIAAALALMASRERPLVLDGVDQPEPQPAALPELPGDFARYRSGVGRQHGVEPKNIVGALANEGGLARAQIGRITLHDEYSMVELPAGLSAGVLARLSKIKVRGQALNLESFGNERSGSDLQRKPRAAAERGPRSDRGAAGDAPPPWAKRTSRPSDRGTGGDGGDQRPKRAAKKPKERT